MIRSLGLQRFIPADILTLAMTAGTIAFGFACYLLIERPLLASPGRNAPRIAEAKNATL